MGNIKKEAQPMFKRLDLYNEEMEKIYSPVQCSAMLDKIATEIPKCVSTLNIYQVAINGKYYYLEWTWTRIWIGLDQNMESTK